MRKVIQIPMNLYRVTLIKMVNGTGPALYRLTNMHTLEYDVIAASDIWDRILNDGWKIENLGSRHGVLHVIDNDGYESASDIIMTDEFTESKSLFDYCLNMANGSLILNPFNTVRNGDSPANIPVDSKAKYYWTCSKGHTIYCDIPTYLALNGECPFCSSEKNGLVHSFYTWAKYANNIQLLTEYNMSQNNKPADEIPYKSRGKVYIGSEQVNLNKLVEGICKDELKRLGE